MRTIEKFLSAGLCACLVLLPGVTSAAPQGGKVQAGAADIRQSGGATSITQHSDRAVINWKAFDIGKEESVRHQMPSSGSAALHRVVGKGGPSSIEGLLQSNGNIYLVNPAGVIIHKGARVEVNGFVAATRDITDSNFMKGHMVFDTPGLPDATVINQGNVSVGETGLAALVAPTVRNEGVIAGRLAKVALAGGDATWKLDLTGDELITFALDEGTVDTLHAGDGTPLAQVHNSGKVRAEGGIVALSAAQLDGIVGSVVNDGEISAASVESRGGKILFRGQGSDVDLVNNGVLNASSGKDAAGAVRMSGEGATVQAGRIDATGATAGGTVVATGRAVTLKSGSVTTASGETGGGQVLIGGNARGNGPEKQAARTTVEQGARIHADAGARGDGGEVVIWADERTEFNGVVTATGGRAAGDGGQVETSGRLLLVGGASLVNTEAPGGATGTWLLDPDDFTIANEGGNIAATTIMEQLAHSNMSILSDSFGLGDIHVNDAISWSADTALHLVARNDININAPITATGDDAGLYLDPKSGKLNIYSPVTLSGSNPTLFIGNKQYIVINTLDGLQAMNDNLAADYALGTNIDASATKSWNGGAGFKPIGYEENKGGGEFTGVFNGLGHIISGLTINRPNDEFVALFGHARLASVSNVGLENVSIRGRRMVGSLMGQSYCSEIFNSYSTGSVTGHWYVGGFIGRLFGGNMMDPIGAPFITNCYTTCNIKKLYSNSDYFGGFLVLADGWESYVRNSYCTGSVPDTEHSGAFCNELGVLGHVENSFYDIDTSGIQKTHGGIGLGTDAMMQEDTYISHGWDFENIWTMEEGKTFPELRLFAANAMEPDDLPKPEVPGEGEQPPAGAAEEVSLPKPPVPGNSIPAVMEVQIPDGQEANNIIVYNTVYGDPIVIYDNSNMKEYRYSIEQNNFAENLIEYKDEIGRREEEYFHSDAFNELPLAEQLYMRALKKYEDKRDLTLENISYITECNKVLLFRTLATDLIEAGFGSLVEDLLEGSVNLLDLLGQLGKAATSKKIRDLLVKSYLTNVLFDYAAKYLDMIESINYNPNLSNEEKTKRIALCLRNSTFFYVAGMKILDAEREQMYKTADNGFLANFFDAEKRLIKTTLKKIKNILNPLKDSIIEEADLIFATDLPKLYNFVQDVNDIKICIETTKDTVKQVTAPFEKVSDTIANIQGFIADVNADPAVQGEDNFIRLVEMAQYKI